MEFVTSRAHNQATQTSTEDGANKAVSSTSETGGTADEFGRVMAEDDVLTARAMDKAGLLVKK